MSKSDAHFDLYYVSSNGTRKLWQSGLTLAHHLQNSIVLFNQWANELFPNQTFCVEIVQVTEEVIDTRIIN